MTFSRLHYRPKFTKYQHKSIKDMKSFIPIKQVVKVGVMIQNPGSNNNPEKPSETKNLSQISTVEVNLF